MNNLLYSITHLNLFIPFSPFDTLKYTQFDLEWSDVEDVMERYKR